MQNNYIILKILLLVALAILSTNTYSQRQNDSINNKTFATIESYREPVHVGLVLSGGGAKGLAHIGVLKVLEQEGIYVDYVAGTSMGGLVGGLYASGYSPMQLDSITKSMPWTKLMSDESERSDLPLDEKTSIDEYFMRFPVSGFIPGLPKGLRAGQLVLNYINKLTWPVAHIKDFSKLPTPFFCVATKLESGDTMVLKSGNISEALRATMSIPTIFEPVKYGNTVLIDGMMVNNFPVDIMRMNKDVDFIIGVDVGSPLLNVNEITNIISILEQTSSYHAYSRFLKNVEITDLYLKPNVGDISALDFSDVGKIIDRGEQVAKDNIDLIRALAKKVRDNKKKYTKNRDEEISEMIFLSEIKMEGLRKVPKKMVLGRLGLNLPGVNNIMHINEAIDRLYSSHFFKSIDYKLEKQLNSYVLNISVIEKSENLFEVGANYNSDIGAGLKMNFLFNNIVFKGSKTNLAFVLGNNPSGNLKFITERGKKIGAGIDIGYKSRPYVSYDKDFSHITSEYYTRFINVAVYGNINYSNNAAFQAGISFDFFDISSKITPIPIENLGIFYNHVYAKFTNDSYDNKYFPTKGSYFSAKVNIINVGRPETGFFAKTRMSTVVKLTNKISYIPQVFVGALWSYTKAKEYAYYYVIGGSVDSQYANYVYMPGLPFSTVVASNTAIAYNDLRYQLSTNNFIFLKTSVGVSSEIFEELLINSLFIYSGTLGYTYRSPIGPLGFNVGISNLTKDLAVYIFMGMDI